LNKATVERLDNEILKVTYPNKGHITLDVFHNIYDQIRNLTSEPAQIMVLGHRVYYVEYEALELTTSPEVVAMISAQAIITKTRLECLLGKLYLKTHPTKYPSRCFLSEDEAQHWLLNNEKESCLLTLNLND